MNISYKLLYDTATWCGIGFFFSVRTTSNLYKMKWALLR